VTPCSVGKGQGLSDWLTHAMAMVLQQPFLGLYIEPKLPAWELPVLLLELCGCYTVARGCNAGQAD